MSATGRGERLDKSGNDYYGTPHWCVDRFLEKIQLPSGLWVEPGAGKGNIIRAVNSIRNDIDWIAIERDRELVPAGDNIISLLYDDFLTGKVIPSDEVKVVIGNPPYNQAIDFILQSRGLYQNAYICFLLRINF